VRVIEIEMRGDGGLREQQHREEQRGADQAGEFPALHR
jgi:hypothetical protein